MNLWLLNFTRLPSQKNINDLTVAHSTTAHAQKSWRNDINTETLSVGYEVAQRMALNSGAHAWQSSRDMNQGLFLLFYGLIWQYRQRVSENGERKELAWSKEPQVVIKSGWTTTAAYFDPIDTVSSRPFQ